MRSLTQKLCTWSGVVSLILFFLGLLWARFLPVPSPALTPIEVAEMYRRHAGDIRVGMVFLMLSSAFVSPLVAVISIQLNRIPQVGQLWSYTQMSAGTVGILFFVLPSLLFFTAAYRPERSPELTYMLNDFCWIVAIMPWPPAGMQNIAIGTAILQDRSPVPIFPRWLGYFNYFVTIMFFSLTLIPFFKSGPFAWNGILGFWLPAISFGIWFIVMVIELLKAIDREQSQVSV